MAALLSIAEASSVLGVAPHVLRHWEDCGVLRPDRARNGHRRYGREHLDQARIVLIGQAGGLTLAQLRRLLDEVGPARRTLLREHRDALLTRAAQTESALRLVDHVLECRTGSPADCAACQAVLGAACQDGAAEAAPLA